MFVFLITIFFLLLPIFASLHVRIRDLHISTCEYTVQYNGIGNLHAFLLGKSKRRRTGHICFFTNHPPMHGRWKIWLHSGITWHASPSSKSSKHMGQPPSMDVPWLLLLLRRLLFFVGGGSCSNARRNRVWNNLWSRSLLLQNLIFLAQGRGFSGTWWSARGRQEARRGKHTNNK